MVAISFSDERFVDLIRQCKKTQTVRPYKHKRFEQIKRIGKLQLYFKQRTKRCFKIADAELTEIFKIRLYKPVFNPRGFVKCLMTYKDGILREMGIYEIDELIKRDGFSSVAEFYNFLKKKYGNKWK